MNISRLELLINMGFENDPFKGVIFPTLDGMRIEKILKMAVKSNAMISIVGDRGAGKTRAVTDALKKMKISEVRVRATDKNRTLISDIEQAMIFDLSDETPRRGREIRSRQLRRILGEASTKQAVVVVIEEAHRLHGMTLRSIKSLRELDWMGETELFACILLGQSDPMNKPGVAEVRLRADTVRMQGLSKKEIAGYVRESMGTVFTEDAIQAVSQLSGTDNFLDLQGCLVALMASAAVAGRIVVTIDDVLESGKEKTIISTPGKDAKHPARAGNDALKEMLERKKTDESSLRVAGMNG